jgi:MarR family transcriptional regulator, organic hydroperoxide resistance regulator
MVKRKASHKKNSARAGNSGKNSPIPPIDMSDRLARLIHDAEKLLVRTLRVKLAERSIAHSHWLFLRILWRQDGVSQTELSRLVGVMTPSTFAAVKAMQKLGYVVRKQKPGNRKKVYIYLTAKGRALERELTPLGVEVNTIATAGMTERQITDFRNTLIGLIKNLIENANSGSAHLNPLVETATNELVKSL